MSFQAYLDNIEAKTGKTAADFKTPAAKKGFTQDGKLKPELKAGQIVQWLRTISIWAVATPWRSTPSSKAPNLVASRCAAEFGSENPRISVGLR